MTDERKEGQRCPNCGSPSKAARSVDKRIDVCTHQWHTAQPQPRGSEALEDYDVLSDVMEIFWPLGTTDAQDALFDKQRAALKKVLTEYFVPLAAATAERTPQEEQCGNAEIAAILTNADTRPTVKIAPPSEEVLLPDQEWKSLSPDSQHKLQMWHRLAIEHLQEILDEPATAERTLLLKKLANGWIETGQLGTGLRSDEYVTAHKEAIMGIYEHCGKTLLEYLAYEAVAPTKEQVGPEPRHLVTAWAEKYHLVGRFAVELEDLIAQLSRQTFTQREFKRLHEQLTRTEALFDAANNTILELGIKLAAATAERTPPQEAPYQMEPYYSRGWQSAIEAAAQVVDNELASGHAKRIAWAIRSLRPSPAPPQPEEKK